MDPYTAAELVRTLGALASMVSAYIAIRREKRELSLSEGEKIASLEYSKVFYGDEEDVKVFQALPKDIGIATNDRIQKVLRGYAEAIKSPLNAFELDRETERAEFEICHTLRLIMKHNNGVLPTKKLKKLWEAFNCDKTVH